MDLSAWVQIEQKRLHWQMKFSSSFPKGTCCLGFIMNFSRKTCFLSHVLFFCYDLFALWLHYHSVLFFNFIIHLGDFSMSVWVNLLNLLDSCVVFHCMFCRKCLLMGTLDLVFFFKYGVFRSIVFLLLVYFIFID